MLNRAGIITLLTLLSWLSASVLAEEPKKTLTPAERKKLEQEHKDLHTEFQKVVRAQKYSEAMTIQEKVLQVEKRLYGETDDKVVIRLRVLSKLYEVLGEFPLARNKLEEVIKIRAEVHGKDHWQTGDARRELEDLRLRQKLTPAELKQLKEALKLNNEAIALCEAGQFKKAVPLALKVVEIRKAVLGDKHPSTATGLNNLAEVYHSLGDYLKALPLSEQACQIRKTVLGNRHPETANSLNNLALLYKTQGDYSKALPLFRQALKIQQAVLGDKHPDTALSLNNLAGMYYSQGYYEEAEPLYRQALRINKATLGEKHSKTATSLNNLAELYHSQGDYAKALALSQQAYQIRKAVRGEKHPDTISSLNNLAMLYKSQGDYAKALPLSQQAYELYKSVLGEKHPETAISLNNLAVLYDSQGNYAKALPLYEQALQITKAIQGEKHLDVAVCLGNLAGLYLKKKEHAKALPLLEQAYQINKTVLGENHAVTALSLNNLAELYHSQGNAIKALPLYEQALKITKAQRGEKHPDTADSLANLGGVHQTLGDFDNAIKWYRQSAKVFLASRDLVSQEGLERATFTSEHSPLILLSSVLAHNKKPRKAWEWLEKSLGRSTWDELQIRRQLSDKEKTELQSLKRQIQSRQKLLNNLATKSKLSDDQKALQKKWLSEQGELYAKLGEFQQKLRDKYGVLGGKSLTLKEIQSALSPQTALLTWIDTKFEHWAVVVRAKGDPVFVPIPGTGSKGAWINKETALADNLRTQLVSPTRNWKMQAEALKKQRIEPVLKQLKGINHLVILPSRMMDGIPIELITEKTVSYAPSGTMVAYVNSLKAAKGNTLLALGDPLFATKLKAPPLPEHGLLLEAVVPGSSAAKAGLMVDDVLQSYHGTTLKTFGDLTTAKAQPELPRVVRVKYWRKGKIRETEIQTGKLGVTIARGSAPDLLAKRHKDRELLAKLRGGDWQELPGTRVEVDALKARFNMPTIYTDSAASEQTLQKLLKNGDLAKVRYLHFATHGEVNRINQMQSAIILSHDQLPDVPTAVKLLEEGKDVPDGKLTAREVLESWKLDAELVTISACESGLGKKEKGEGFMGFSQAFLLSGAHSVVLSMWKVDDTATALLMDRFYENLLGQRKGIKPMTKALALREAKEWLRTLPRTEVLARAAKISKGVARGKGNPDLPLLKAVPKVSASEKDAPYAHPYYWAAFILIGSSK